ncbi:hypothetical protein O181_002337 [Austropuccinia psidii MF-1]|uniref:Uncharacterized protein n=1 Tax=Austropuccinia psidii MF-1 TaxID=1389203 RepID=A0A9Q3BC98_9BASI|nr:hypothetical protein [Austropuccinia psidii MF-1]
MGIFTASTSSPSNLALPSASVLVGELEILLIIYTTPWLLILEMRNSDMDSMGPPTLVNLATSLCLAPVTKARQQNNIKPRRPQHLQLEWPKVPSGVRASESGNSLPKVPFFFLHKDCLTSGSGTPGH